MGAELGVVYLQRKTMETILSSNNIVNYEISNGYATAQYYHKQRLWYLTTEPRKGHFFSNMYKKRNRNKKN